MYTSTGGFQVRTFILGAGFSFPAGLPLTNELGPLVIDAVLAENPSADIRDWIITLVRSVHGVTSSQLNAELLFEAAYTLRELAESQITIPTAARQAEKTLAITEEGIALLRKAVVQVIWQSELRADLAHVRAFANALHTGDIIISFNYDTLVERALDQREMAWDNVLNDFAGGEGVKILKLHGSINWVRSSQNALADAPLLRLWSAGDWPNDQNAINDRTDARALYRILNADTWMHYFLGELSTYSWSFALAPLGARKSIRDVPALGRLWAAASDFLISSDRVYAVGFSLSPYDHMARLLLVDAARPRMDGGRPVVAVIDPNAHALAANYATAVRTRVVACPEGAERVEWAKLDEWVAAHTTSA